jgi:hypothetical protein
MEVIYKSTKQDYGGLKVGPGAVIVGKNIVKYMDMPHGG